MSASAPRNMAESPAAPARHRLDVGPRISLPTARLFAAIVVAFLITGGAGWLIADELAPQARWAVWRGAGGAAGAFLIALAALAPWKVRHLGRWPVAWLRHLGAAFGVTLAAAGLLLYSASTGEHAALGVTLAAGHFVTLMAEVVVIAHCFAPYRASSSDQFASESARSS